MTAYELNTRASSPWIDVFTTEEWISFAHLWNVNFYYCSGYLFLSSILPSQLPHNTCNTNDNNSNSPGSNYTSALGALYLNASLTLLQQGPSSSGPLFFNLYHTPPPQIPSLPPLLSH